MDKRFKFFPGKNQLNQSEFQLKELAVNISIGKSYKEIDKINIELSLLNDSEVNFSLLNVVGKVIFQLKDYCHKGICTVQLCKTELSKGLYYLEIITGENSLVKRIAIE